MRVLLREWLAGIVDASEVSRGQKGLAMEATQDGLDGSVGEFGRIDHDGLGDGLEEPFPRRKRGLGDGVLAIFFGPNPSEGG